MALTQRLIREEPINLTAIVYSHGWWQLPPFHYERESGVLAWVQHLNDGRVVQTSVQADSNTSRASFLLIQTEGDVYQTDLAEVDAAVRRVLCLGRECDMQIAAFYEAIRQYPAYAWVIEKQAGRLLRSPTVWQDLAKTLLTTNTTWRQTVEMCKRLVTLGDQSLFGHAFPTPAQVAALTADDLTAYVRCGYRGPYLHELAERIASGELDVEAWALPGHDSADLYKQITALKGFGAYAAGSVLRLLGHHDRLSIDTEARAAFIRLHHPPGSDEKPTDAQIRAHYKQYGQWRGLMMWMDVTRRA